MSSYEVGQCLFRARASGIRVHYEVWVVEKVTPKGGWVVPSWEWNIYVSKTTPRAGDTELEALARVAYEPKWQTRKWIPFGARFASTTEKEAADRFLRRSESYVKHCRRRLQNAERRVATAEAEVRGWENGVYGPAVPSRKIGGMAPMTTWTVKTWTK